MNHIQQPPLSFSDSQSPVDDSNFQIDKNEQNKKYDLSFSDPSMKHEKQVSGNYQRQRSFR
jgi:hypothetical protein